MFPHVDGLDPKPVGFRPNGGGDGSVSPPVGLGFGDPNRAGCGGGFSDFPDGARGALKITGTYIEFGPPGRLAPSPTPSHLAAQPALCGRLSPVGSALLNPSRNLQ